MKTLTFALIFIFTFTILFLTAVPNEVSFSSDSSASRSITREVATFGKRCLFLEFNNVYAEEVTVTTYYPAPEGVYAELQAEKYYGYPKTLVPGETDIYYGLDPNEVSYLNNLDISGAFSVDYLAGKTFYDTDDPNYSPPIGAYFLDPYPPPEDPRSLTVAGNVGIGTTDPTALLDVQGGTASTGAGVGINLYAQNGYGPGSSNGGDIILMPGAHYGPSTSVRDGHVGIGTTNPTDALLHIHGYPNLALTRTTFNGALMYLNYIRQLSDNGQALISTAPGYEWRISTATNPLQTDMIMDANGNVGIGGQWVPKNKLDVAGAVAVGSGFAGVVTAPPDALVVSGSVGIGAVAAAARLTVETPALWTGNVIRFQSDWEPGNYWLNLSAIEPCPGVVEWVFDQKNGSMNYPDVLVFDRGKIGIGTTSPEYKFQVVPALGVEGHVSPQTGGWFNSSDIRLKKNISTLEDTLNKISRLRGVRYDRKNEPNTEEGKGKHIGFIAQELEKEFPELVETGADGYKSVTESSMTAILVEAIKEQQKEIELLKQEVAELKRSKKL